MFRGDDDKEGTYVNSHHANNGHQNHFPFKILNNLQPDELVITLSPFSSGIVIFLIISKQKMLATAACFHYVTNHPRARVPIRNEKKKKKIYRTVSKDVLR